MTAKTFDSIGPTFTPAPTPRLRPDRPAFAVDAPATTTVETTRRAETPMFAGTSPVFVKMHTRQKRPIAALVAGAAVILTGAVLFATSGHKPARIGAASSAPAEATPATPEAIAPAPVAAAPLTPASAAPIAKATAPAARVAPSRVAPTRVARAERTVAPRARAVTPSVASTPTVAPPAPVAATPAPTVVAPPPVVVAPAPVVTTTPSDPTPQ